MTERICANRLHDYTPADNTNHRCMWYSLAAICDASFNCGLWAPSLGKGWSWGLKMGSPSSPVLDFLSTPHSNHRPISCRFRSAQTYPEPTHKAKCVFIRSEKAIVREYVFYVFFSKSKKRDFLRFWSVVSKNVKNVESVFQVFTFLHFEIANGHFRCKTITQMSCYTYNIILNCSFLVKI